MRKWWFSGVIARAGGCAVQGFADREADVLVDLDPIAQLGGHAIDICLDGSIRVLDERLFQHAVGMPRPGRRTSSRI